MKAVRGHDRAQRQAARDLVHSRPVLGCGDDGDATATLIDTAFSLAIASAWHAKRHHSQQAAAAQQAAEHLSAAYQAAAAHPMAILRQRGHRLAPRVRQRQTDLLHQVLPELAEPIRAEPGWPAPAALLVEATRRRELDTAASISDVLVWRLRRSAHLPAAPEDPHDAPTRGSRRTASPAPSTQPAPNALNDSSRRL